MRKDQCSRCEELRQPKSRYCKKCKAAYMREWRKTHRLPESQIFKDKVRHKTLSLIKRGLLIRKPCEICGDEKVEAHHDDYDKPCDVRWLCQNHHNLFHEQDRIMSQAPGIDEEQLVFQIIGPTLHMLDMYSPDALALMASTCAAESQRGEYVNQEGLGYWQTQSQKNVGGLGPWQCEEATHADLFNRYGQKLIGFAPGIKAERMIYDWRYACAIARLKYYSIPEVIPDRHNVSAMATYWKTHYNCSKDGLAESAFIFRYAGSPLQAAVEKYIAYVDKSSKHVD